MKPINNWENIKEVDDFPKLKPGGYVAVIKNVEDVVEKEYLKISYDIAEGEFKNYYYDLYQSMNFWGGSFIRSYKDTAASMFKSFIGAVERSNIGFKFDFNERKLVGKVVGIVLQEEEYKPESGKHAGELRTRLIVQEVRSVDTIRKGDYKVKPKKTLSERKSTDAEDAALDKAFDDALYGNTTNIYNINDQDIQF